MALRQPTSQYVRSVIRRAKGDSRYFGADPAVRLVFETWPKNTDGDQVLIKCVVLNRLYSTNIFDIYSLRDHILRLDIDARLARGDPSLVNALADFRRGRKKRWLISFASKYCAWHRPEAFQIFDGLVEWILLEYKKRYEFANFGRFDLRDYPTFVTVLDRFRSRFGLEEFSRKDTDKFLWIEAKNS
jgi:hypothetical protein